MSLTLLQSVRKQRAMLGKLVSQEVITRLSHPFELESCHTAMQTCQMINRHVKKGFLGSFLFDFCTSFILTAYIIVILRWLIWVVAILCLPSGMVEWLFG